MPKVLTRHKKASGAQKDASILIKSPLNYEAKISYL